MEPNAIENFMLFVYWLKIRRSPYSIIVVNRANLGPISGSERGKNSTLRIAGKYEEFYEMRTNENSQGRGG